MCQIFVSVLGSLDVNKTEIPTLMNDQVYSSPIVKSGEGLTLTVQNGC